MVMERRPTVAAAAHNAIQGEAGAADLVLHVDGRHQLSAASIAALQAICDRAEDLGGHTRVIVHVTGAPQPPKRGDLTVTLVSRWERALQRLERIPAVTIAVADGDCGGPALDTLLATDYRIATTSMRLLVPSYGGATWPGMALYRLARQTCVSAIRLTALFGSPIEAHEALSTRLVNRVTDDVDSALAEARELTRFFTGSELAIRRRLVLDALEVGFDDALGSHLAACDRMLRRSASEEPARQDP